VKRTWLNTVFPGTARYLPELTTQHTGTKHHPGREFRGAGYILSSPPQQGTRQSLPLSIQELNTTQEGSLEEQAIYCHPHHSKELARVYHSAYRN